jgi:antirestriction protein ArdC
MHIHKLYEEVTAAIIRDLEAGVAPWTKPWRDGNFGNSLMPINAATNRNYSGINIPILWFAKEQRGFKTHRWMTYRQALPLDAHVRKGEEGTTVVFTKKHTFRDKETDEEKRIGFLRTFTVFNVEQIDGLPDQFADPGKKVEQVDLLQDDPIQRFIDATKAEIISGDQPMYIPLLDLVAMPPVSAFKSREHHHATTLHELSHWTGSKKRLDRDLSGRFGTQSHAAEELVAELSAAFLCAHLGIEGRLRHSEYIANWLTLLKSDSRAIFTAASKASAAADYLRSYSETVQEEAA